MTRTLKIGMLWHAPGHKNLGVDALSVTSREIAVSAARRVGAEVQFTVFNFRAGLIEPSAAGDFVEPTIKDLMNPFSRFHTMIGRQDLVIDIGEGDSFSDIYGGRRLFQQVTSKLATRRKRVPLVLAPQTIGPFATLWTKRLASLAMGQAALVAARDPASLRFARELRSKPVERYSDLAFRLPFDEVPLLGRIGINVSGLLYRGNVAHFGNPEFNYRDFIHATLDALETAGEQVTLVPHVLNPGATDDDVEVSAEIARDRPGVTVAPSFATASEAKSYISGLRGLIAARMHACIGGVSSGVAVLPVAYSRKFNGLFLENGYPFLVDATADSMAVALDKLHRFLANLDGMEASAIQLAAQQSSRLSAYEDALVDVMREVVR